MLEGIRSNVGKVLFAVAMGRDLTKLDIKARASLSMSTVISTVDRLTRQGLVTFTEEKGPRGGKMRSVINVHPLRRAYGLSYKSGVLTASAVNLKGEECETLSQEVMEGALLTQSVKSVLFALLDRAPKPLAVAFSLNCENKQELLSSLEDRLGVPCISSANSVAVAYLSLWKGAERPVAALGVGNGVKCALLSEQGRRIVDFGDLPSTCLLTGEGTFRSVLSVARVEDTLRSSDYRGLYYMRGGRPAEVKDLGEYSRFLSKELASLTDLVATTLDPKRVVLFGDYLSEAFFERIKREVRACAPDYLAADRADFALGTALCALTETLFN